MSTLLESKIESLEKIVMGLSAAMQAMKMQYESELLLIQDEIDAAQSNDYGHDPVAFSGTVWVAGTQLTGLDDLGKRYVTVNFANNTAAESDGPPVSGDPNIEWYDKTETYGDIHVVRG